MKQCMCMTFVNVVTAYCSRNVLKCVLEMLKLYRGDHQYRDTSHFWAVGPFHLIFVAKGRSRREYDRNDTLRLVKHTCKKW